MVGRPVQSKNIGHLMEVTFLEYSCSCICLPGLTGLIVRVFKTAASIMVGGNRAVPRGNPTTIRSFLVDRPAYSRQPERAHSDGIVGGYLGHCAALAR